MDSVNLLPDRYRASELWRGRASRWALLGLGFVLLVMGYSLIIGRHAAAVKRELASLEKQVAEKEDLSLKLAQLETELQRAVEKQGTLNEVLDQRGWAQVFADIAEAARGNAWLERTRFTKVKVRQTPNDGDSSDEDARKEEALVIIEVEFTAQGHADSNFDLANFMARLESSPHFDDVELNYSELTEADRKEPAIRFEIKGKLL